MLFIILVYVSDEGVTWKAYVFCFVFVHFGAALYLFYGASQLFTKLNCDIQFN